jgi:hypothetical protein
VTSGFADELVWSEATERLEASGEVIGVVEAAQMKPQLIMRIVEMAFDGCVPNGSVHPFDLPVCPWVFGLGQAMIGTIEGAGVFEGVRP